MKNKTLSLLIILLTVVLLKKNVYAQTVEDFQLALSKEGCESIPYDDLRSRCHEYQGKVNSYKSPGDRSCDDMNPTPLKENMSRMNDKISSLKREIDSYQNSRSSASTDDEKKKYEELINKNNEEINRLQNEINIAKEKLYKEKSLLEANMNAGAECLKARSEVQWCFSKASERAAGESDEKKKEIGKDLISKWTKGAETHKQSTQDWEKQYEKCKNYYSNN